MGRENSERGGRQTVAGMTYLFPFPLQNTLETQKCATTHRYIIL
jgi:hypothetical protein